MEVTFERWFAGAPSTQIAMFHTFFNVICTALFLPFINVFVKVSKLLVKDKKKERKSSFIDDRFLKTPSIALTQAGKETLRIGQISMDTLALSIDAFLNKNLENEETIKQNIQDVEELNRELLSYLVKIAATDLTDKDELMVSKLHESLNDFYREAEIADNMIKYTKSAEEQQLKFSDKVYNQIKLLGEKLQSQFENVSELFETQNKEVMSKVDAIENEIDEMRSKMIKQHIDRLEKNECSPASSGVFINLVSNLERAGDHLVYIAHTLVD